MRLWSVTADPRYAKPISGRLRFALTPMALVDLLAVLPFWLPLNIKEFYVFRAVRVAKLGRYSRSVQMLGRVLKSKRAELASTLFLLVLLLLLSSTLMFYAEKDEQGDVFTSIPQAMWWGVATLTTVGYGDVYPVTPLGKMLGSVIAVLGIGMFALPAGFLGAGCVEELERQRNKKSCPHCGKEL